MNTKRKIKNIASILAVTAMMLVLSVSTALADAPSNDNFADATVIENIPFEDSQDIAQATIEPDDPWTSCVGRENSIWYRYTPTDDDALNITFSSGEGGAIMYAIFSLESEGLTEISCEYTMPRTITIDVIAGTTYYIELLSPAYYPVRTVSINITHPPENDDFADAEVISVIPFSTSQSTVEATVEESDPDTCTGRYKSIWYVYTPSENTSLTISANTYDYYSVTLSVYRLESEGLVQLSCGSYYQVTTVQGMTAGATYYVELMATISYPWQTYDGNNVSIDIYPTPLPEAYFSYWPGDPSIYDHIQFNNDSYDPAGIGFESCSWDFGMAALLKSAIQRISMPKMAIIQSN